MYSSQAIGINFEPERTLAFGAVGAAFTALGTPLAFPSIQFVMNNQTDQAIQFSIDGVNSVITLPSGCFYTSDVAANQGLGGECMLPQRKQIYVRYVAVPAAGAVYFTTMYRNNNNNL